MQDRKHLVSAGVDKLMDAAKGNRNAALPLPIHPYILRYDCSFTLANQGVDAHLIQGHLGHRHVAEYLKFLSVSQAYKEVDNAGN